jgi:flagellar biosynthesis regulator FlbT
MSPKNGPTLHEKIDYDNLINNLFKEKFYGYKNNSQFEINDNLTDPKILTHYMKRLFMVIYKTYINKKERNDLFQIYFKHIQQFMIKFKLNDIYSDIDIYKAAGEIFEKSIKDCAVVQQNNLNHNPYQNPWEDTKNILYKNNRNELKILKIITN